MRKIIFYVFMSSSLWLAGQNSADVRLVEKNTDDDLICFDLQLDYEGDDVALASQNYRLFYSAQALHFVKEKSGIYLPLDQYSFNVVQHNEGIDASGIGDLSFEDDLGFINATIIFNDPRLEGYKLSKTKGWSSIIKLCFESIEFDIPKEVILAREEVSASYGRAFIELSHVDKAGNVASLPIKNYIDFRQ